MLQQNGSGNIDWMSLAAKMFMSKLTNQNLSQKQFAGKSTSPLPSPLCARSPNVKTRSTVQPAPGPSPSQLPPDCLATIKQFEALRVQLLRQLVLYQTQLLALKMPYISGIQAEPIKKTIQPRRNVTKSGLNKVKKQTNKKVKPVETHEEKKWEKIPLPAHALKNSKRRVHQKPKKSSKKASKRKLENVQTLMLNNYFKGDEKKLCQQYKSYLGGYSSSTDSVYSTKHKKCNYNCCVGSSKGHGKEAAQTPSEGLSSTCVSRLTKRKGAKLNKKISSSLVFDTVLLQRPHFEVSQLSVKGGLK